jgi:uncharacterized protein YfiM (DUF2279 family)
MRSSALAGVLICGLLATNPARCDAQRVKDSRASIGRVIAHQTDTTTEKKSTHAPDTLFGADKVKHFMLSGFIELVGFSGLEWLGATRNASLAGATGVSLGIGLARELHDRRSNGLFSLGDLTWDALGVGAALAVISHSQR